MRILFTLFIGLMVFGFQTGYTQQVKKQDSLETLAANAKDDKDKVYKRYIGISLPYQVAQATKKSPFDYTYGFNLTIEWYLHQYISFVDNTFLFAWKKNDKTSFVFGYDLGFRFYLANPIFYLETRIGLKDHFKYWDTQYYIEYLTALVAGVSYPITNRLKIEAYTGVYYSFYNKYDHKVQPDNDRSPSRVTYASGIGFSWAYR